MSMTRTFDFVIVGGGILGTIVAALAVEVGKTPLVIRLGDHGAPRADTLRNQAWLQSGVMFPTKHFDGLDKYATFAARTYISGRNLLLSCNLPIPTEGGILKASEEFHLSQLDDKLAVLKLSEDEFRRLDADEAEAAFGEHFEASATYFRIPDGPFNEAGVLDFYREKARAGGAIFIEVADPVRLEKANNAMIVVADELRIEAPLVVVTAGAGSFDLMEQIDKPLNGALQRTPLVVADAPLDMAAPIIVDLDLGFSAVRHELGGELAAAVVMGTRANALNAPSVDAAERCFSQKELDEFSEGVPPSFQESFQSGRYTAGYEVVPGQGTGLRLYQPWIVPNKRVIFASPGRATISLQTGVLLMGKISMALKSTAGQVTNPIDLSSCVQWDCHIHMHYMPNYTYNDANNKAA